VEFFFPLLFVGTFIVEFLGELSILGVPLFSAVLEILN